MSRYRRIFLWLSCLVTVLDGIALALAIGLKETGVLTPLVMSYHSFSGGKLAGGTAEVGWSIGNYSFYIPIFAPLMTILAASLLCLALSLISARQRN